MLWGSTNMLMGWASGRFGLFGLTKQGLSNPDLNSVGVVVAVVALVVFMFVKPEDMNAQKKGNRGFDDEYYDSEFRLVRRAVDRQSVSPW